MDTFLYFSPPGNTNYQFYEESNSGDVEFTFHPFDDILKIIKVQMIASDENSKFNLIPFDEDKFQCYSKSNYTKLLEETIKKIKENQLGKIVISRSNSILLQGQDPIDFYHKLCIAYPKACVYLFQHPVAGVWIGATPETLVEGREKVLRTMSLAGTRIKGEEATFNEKEDVEQSIVTEYIVEQLKEFHGVDSVKVGVKDKLDAGNVVHFVNQIQAKMEGSFNLDLFLKTFHPTPAVGGYPKEEALQFIKDLEKYDRSFYAGYFGLRHKNSFHYFVNLRCLQWFKDYVLLYAGGGITIASDPEKEWEETEAKMRTLLNVLAS